MSGAIIPIITAVMRNRNNDYYEYDDYYKDEYDDYYKDEYDDYYKEDIESEVNEVIPIDHNKQQEEFLKELNEKYNGDFRAFLIDSYNECMRELKELEESSKKRSFFSRLFSKR